MADDDDDDVYIRRIGRLDCSMMGLGLKWHHCLTMRISLYPCTKSGQYCYYHYYCLIINPGLIPFPSLPRTEATGSRTLARSKPKPSGQKCWRIILYYFIIDAAHLCVVTPLQHLTHAAFRSRTRGLRLPSAGGVRDVSHCPLYCISISLLSFV